MKPNSIKLQLILLSAALLSACSGMKMASDELLIDDVYNTQVQAKEYSSYYQDQPRSKYAIDSAIYQEYLAELPFDPSEVNYANRINRFNYFNPWRAYYDGIYGYMPHHLIYDYSYNAYLSGRDYGYFPYYNSRYGFNLGVNQFPAWFGRWSYWGNPYGPFNGLNYWGPLSMFDYYHVHHLYGNGMWGPYWGSPWYGGGFFGGGYIGGGMIGGVNPVRNTNYGARPIRGGENGIIYTPRAGAGVPVNNNVRPGGSMNGSRADRYLPQSGGIPTRGSSAPASSARPSRGNNENFGPSRPTMSNPPAPSRSNTPPPSSSSSGSSSRGSSGDGRPGRG